MFTLAADKYEENYNKFIELIKQDSRSEQLLKFYEIPHFAEELTTAPASAKTHFHNAFPGGYLDHVLRVADIALKMAGTFKACEGEINFTKQELIFAALHHDLGKLGVPGTPYYLDQDSDWHRKRGELYKHNEAIQYMKVPDRAVFLLQSHGIQVTEAEYLAIKLSDGMYSDGNEAYLKNWTPYSMKTNLPYIIHWADHMATTIERDKSKF
jgi:hypothetical protein